MDTKTEPKPEAPASSETADPAEKARSGIDKTGRPWALVTLDNPLDRSGTEVVDVTIRKPRGGDLRGTKLTELYAADVVAMSIVIPRISEPMIHRQEFMDMDGEDIAQLSGEVINFLLTKSQRREASLTE
ncbi:MAG: phage tail assembly protein [Brevundimonas sp.]|uniref:phage tail assembly protein n=1 Tax=Brevundimonas sp. TaxID=1871086 RepID=UPI0027720338|nr:phage tail assembly protein [Brevundimonas sp.]MDP3400718.1 phage tail assembly protein [Brevundimonas sp.]MDZ4108145.1 phage tail assembly protein [Brevundimonas sp.]